MPTPEVLKESHPIPWINPSLQRGIMTARGYSRSVILCVDDHSDGLELRKQVLERAGYKTLATTSARKALELFRGNHVDLVLTEHLAPTMLAGYTTAAVMKMLKPRGPIAT